MFKYFLGLVIATAAISSITLVSRSEATPRHVAAPACLAIAPGVCFSGSVEWVASQAEKIGSPAAAMVEMQGEAI